MAATETQAAANRAAAASRPRQAGSVSALRRLDFARLPEQETPEMVRSDLAGARAAARRTWA